MKYLNKSFGQMEDHYRQLQKSVLRHSVQKKKELL